MNSDLAPASIDLNRIDLPSSIGDVDAELSAMTDDPDAGVPSIPRRPRTTTADSVLEVIVPMLSALCFVAIVFSRLMPLSGGLGFFVVWYVAFVVFYLGAVWLRAGSKGLGDRFATVLLTSAGMVVPLVILMVIGFITIKGWQAIRPSFLTQTMAFTGPLDPLESGGALHAIVGTLEQVSIALVITIPLGVATALYLNEIGGRFARIVRTVVETMAALPSIVAGLFIYASFVLFFQAKSGLAASLAISVMMLPIITRASEVILRLVPGGLREASYALGASQWRTVWKVVLPTARTGLVTAVVLGTARGIGETAPVLLTAGFTAELNTNPFKGAQVSLPLYIYNAVRQPSDTMVTRAYGAALVLLVLVLTLFGTARVLSGRPLGAPSRRQLRRAKCEQHQRDAAPVPEQAGFTAAVAAPRPATGPELDLKSGKGNRS